MRSVACSWKASPVSLPIVICTRPLQGKGLVCTTKTSLRRPGEVERPAMVRLPVSGAVWVSTIDWKFSSPSLP